MKRVIHFEIHADDPAACARCCGDLFGGGWGAYVIDRFGNISGLHQPKTGAA